MSDILKDTSNRGNNITTPLSKQRSIELVDIDTAIINYMNDVVVPELEVDGNKIRPPVIYGSAERWVSAQKQGYFRDRRGKILIPLIMLKRGSVQRDDTLQLFDRNITYPTQRVWSKENKYDKFSVMTNVSPKKELYDITMPTYITLSYDVIMWAHYTEHMNSLVEVFTFTGNEYWGDKDKFKFKVNISDFSIEQDVSDGSERIVKGTFTINANGYILPKLIDNRPTTKTSFSTKQQIITTEIDLGLQPTSPSFIGSSFGEYSSVIEFFAVNKVSLPMEFESTNTFTLSPVDLPTVPDELKSTYPTLKSLFSIFINGVKFSSIYWDVTFEENILTIIFKNEIGFKVNEKDSVVISGRIIQLTEDG